MSQDSEAKARANIEFIKDHLNHYNDEDYYRIKELLTNRSDDDFSNAKEVEALVNKRFKVGFSMSLMVKKQQLTVSRIPREGKSSSTPCLELISRTWLHFSKRT